MADHNEFNDRVDRRRRVARIRNTLLLIIALWFFTSIAVMGILWIRVDSLQRQLDELVEVEVSESENTSQKQASSEANAKADISEKKTTDTKSENQPKSTEKKEQETIDVDPEAQAAAYDKAMEENQKLEEKARDEDRNKIYLTFDGAPNKDTGAVLDLLKEKDIKATFFFDYSKGDEAANLYNRSIQEGHTLGMHSYIPDYDELYASGDGFRENFTMLRDSLKDITGVESDFYRFPGGSTNPAAVAKISMTSLCQFVTDEGAIYVDWNAEDGTATGGDPSAPEMVENIMSHVLDYKSSIIVMNGGSANTVKALPDVIASIEKADKNAVFLPITPGTDRCHFLKLEGEE